MKTILLFIACALLMSTVTAHDMFAEYPHQVKAVQWYSWFTDMFALTVWLVSAIVVFPLGVLGTLFGLPDFYTWMYAGVVTGSSWFKLSSAY